VPAEALAVMLAVTADFVFNNWDLEILPYYRNLDEERYFTLNERTTCLLNISTSQEDSVVGV
jgi:hypothetical protein